MFMACLWNAYWKCQTKYKPLSVDRGFYFLHAIVCIYSNMVTDICIFSLVDKPLFHRSAYCPSFFILLYFSSGILFTFSAHDTLCSWYISTEQEMSISHWGLSSYLQNCYFIRFKYNSSLQRLPFLGNYYKSYSNTIIVHFQQAICILSFLKVDPLFLTIK